MKTNTVKIAEKAFESIAKAFPSLKMNVSEDENVELVMEIPKQVGLKFDINLNLQNSYI